MKAFFPIVEDLAMESRIHPQFGSAPLFLVVDTVAKTCRALPNVEGEDAQGRCGRMQLVDAERVELVVASGIGSGALERLAAAQVRFHCTSRSTVREALLGAALGPLAPPAPGAPGAHHHGCGGAGHEDRSHACDAQGCGAGGCGGDGAGHRHGGCGGGCSGELVARAGRDEPVGRATERR